MTERRRRDGELWLNGWMNRCMNGEWSEWMLVMSVCVCMCVWSNDRDGCVDVSMEGWRDGGIYKERW